MWKLELCGTLIHFFLLISVFDIHLQREVHQGITQNCMNSPLAKRLVLIIANGLDGEKTLNLVKSNTSITEKVKPHIYGIAEKNNLMKSNGITAITGGFEQNPRPFSVIYKHENNEFDQIFNYASKTVYIGELKHLQYFGDKSKHWIKIIINNTNPNNNTYFKTIIDTFKQDSQTERDISIFRGDNIIFLCLLSVAKITNQNDKAGTRFEKKNIIDLFENKIYRLIQTIDRFYNDNDTAFMLCSDNSEMINIEQNNEFYMMWGKGTSNIGEVKINIKDISLMASSILGNTIPIGSAAVWHKSYLNLTLREEATTIACNAFHLSLMASKTLQQVRNKLMEALHFSYEADSQILKQYQTKITNLLNDNSNYSEINGISEDLTTFSLKILEKDVIFMKSMIFYLTHCLFVGWTITLLIRLILFKITKHPDQELRIHILRKKTELWFFGMHTLLILLGTTSVLFIIVKEWPLHYMFYWLITLTVWGYVFGNFQTWTGLMDNMNLKKLAIILLYVVIYMVACESFIWGLKFKLVFSGTIITITLYNWIKSYVTKQLLSLKISLALSGITLAVAILLITVTSKNSLMVIITGIALTVTGVICAYYMRYNAYDFLIMSISIFLSCVSLLIKIFRLYHPIKTLEIISWALFAAGIFLPVFGGVDKINRLQHIAVCFGSSIILFSKSYEPLIVTAVFSFSFLCYLNDKPLHKTKFLNRNNSFQIAIFSMVNFTIMHLMGSLDQTKNQFAIIGDIYEKIKLFLVLIIALTTFVALKHENGGDSQFVMSIILLHYCSYRLFLDMNFYEKINAFSKQLSGYCTIQMTIIMLFATHSFSKFLVHASIMNVKTCLGELFERIFNFKL